MLQGALESDCYKGHWRVAVTGGTGEWLLQGALECDCYKGHWRVTVTGGTGE